MTPAIGRAETGAVALRSLDLPSHVPVVTREAVAYGKPDPDLFLEAARLLGVEVAEAVVVGDSVWDLLAARRARALSVGLLSGGIRQGGTRGRGCVPRLRGS